MRIHLPKAPKPETKREPVPPSEMKRRRRRGRSGEYEVVKLFKKSSWPDAFRTPGSGAWRPYGARDQSPFPLDVASGWPETWPQDKKMPWPGPWMFEVKYDERVMKPGRGFLGESFIRATCKKAEQQWRQYVDSPGAAPVEVGLFARANNSPWRVYVRSAVVMRYVGSRQEEGWTEVPMTFFFDELALFVAKEVAER